MTMDPWRAQRSSEIRAMAALARCYAGSCEKHEQMYREVLALLDHRWVLADEERAWCVDVLVDDSGRDREPIEVMRHTCGILGVEDYALLANCLGWFGSNDAALAAFVGDLSSIGLSVPATIELFPEDVCDAFQLLDIEPTLSVADIDRKYREWAKLLHPDAMVGVELSGQERVDAKALLGRVSNARDVIRMHLRTLLRSTDPDGHANSAVR